MLRMHCQCSAASESSWMRRSFPSSETSPSLEEAQDATKERAKPPPQKAQHDPDRLVAPAGRRAVTVPGWPGPEPNATARA